MAGDPDHYSAVLATVGFADLVDSAARLSSTLVADGAPAQASLVRQALMRLERDLHAIATRTAQTARQEIVRGEEATRVRPDTGGRGGDRLGDHIGASDPLPTVPGSVGINDEVYLESSPVFWWVLHEEGSSIHVGREVHGFFEPGHAVPNRGEERVHPLFAPERDAPKMVIENPIPERRFVQHAIPDIEDSWRTRVRAAKVKFITACEAAVAVAPPPRGARGGRARRRRR